MATVSGTGTTYTLPNYHGELFTVALTQTPFLAAIGNINGAKAVRSKDWEWQTVGRRTSTANNGVLEGQPAPAATNQSRANVSNITEIHQSKVSVSYSKLAATSQYSGVNVGPEWDDMFADELQFQIDAELQSMAVDIEMSFLNGTLNRPTANASTSTDVRKTQGILGAITSNVSAAGGTNRALTPAIINGLLKNMRAAGAPLTQDHTVFLCGSDQLLNITNVYAAQASLSQPTMDRNVGGMNINTIVTPFGTFGVMEDVWMPARQIAIVDLSVCWPVFTEVPGKGVLFTEPLAKTGASEDYQLYGEIGLEYGPQAYHGLIKDLLNSDNS